MIDSYEDMLDVRDIIDAYEEAMDDEYGEGRAEELKSLLDDLRGNGGDHQWEGDWYPVTLIRDSYFVNYAKEFAEGIGAIGGDTDWPAYCIDWERASRELQVDYSTVDYGGTTYWYRIAT